MANILVLLIIILCAVFQYFKGNLTRAVATIIVALSAAFVSFGYYEMLGAVLDKVESLVPWAQVISFMLLFILSFAIMQTLVMLALKEPVDFGLWPERVGRPVVGIFLGWIISGVLLTALSLAPLPTQYPYQRFDPSRPTVGKPKKVLLNADGFITGWFSVISEGAFSSFKSDAESFAMVRADFLDQLFLNRLAIDKKKMSLWTSKEVLTLPRKAACWFAEDLTDIDGQAVSAQAGHKLMIVHMGIRLTSDSTPFTLSQVRAICKAPDEGGPTQGKGICIFPIGTMASNKVVDQVPLNKELSIDKDHGNPRYIDFVFNVPNGTTPTLAQFKLNNNAVISKLVDSADEHPAIVPFGGRSEGDGNVSNNTPTSNEQSPSPTSTSQSNTDRRGLSDISKSVVGDTLLEN